MDLGDSLFAEGILARNNTKHASLSLVTVKLMDRDRVSLVKLKIIISE